MAEYVPNTQVKLLTGVPLDSTYSDTIKFTSAGVQTGYFSGKAKYTYTDFTYQRVNSSVAQPRGPYSIRVPQVADNVYDCNYLMFQNTNYGTKWFYAFIKQVNYINPNNTEIIYELDHYQTWLFDFEVLPCFVEREHTNEDTYYSNLEDEPISLGEYKMAPQSLYSKEYPALYIIVASTTESNGKTVQGSMMGTLYSGLKLQTCSNAGEANAYIQGFSDNGHLDNIVTVFMSPFSITSASPETWSFSVGPSIPGYTPKNKKLLSFPYISLCVLNSTNSSQEFRFEFLGTSGAADPTINFQAQLVHVLCASPRVMMVPNYLGNVPNFAYALDTGGLPSCPWNGNVYANYMAQNALSAAFKMGMGATSNALSGNLAGATASVISTAIDLYSTQYQTTPNRGTFEQDSAFSAGHIGFYVYFKTISAQKAKEIDDFFDVFGYATNRYKVPNMEGRESWNYVKTKDCIIKGSVPVDSMDRIKAMFNNGIRFWHGDFVRDFSRSNNLVEVNNDVSNAGA